MNVLKFGGSSVGTPEALKQVVEIIGQKTERERLVVVVSAFRGITDQLIQAANLASVGNEYYLQEFVSIEGRHIETILTLFPAKNQSEWMTSVKLLLNELEDVLQGVFLIRELSPRTLDYIVGFGERFSSLILSALLSHYGISSRNCDARDLIKTDREFGNARVLTAQTFHNIREYMGRCREKTVVITGFIASTEEGESTTLGRGGSDYTAALIGAALTSKAIEIWTDVDGLMTADPGKVKRAFSVPEASYEEAMELSHFGAKVIYPPTIQPALKAGIPILIKNTFKPAHPGTVIHNSTRPDQGSVRGMSSIDEVSLITLRGSGMIGVTGISARLFSALAEQRINIILITQSSSEHTITLAVAPSDTLKADSALRSEFRTELATEMIDEILLERDYSVIAVVGDNMRQIPGIAGRVFSSLGRNGINIVAIAQGSSERNISFVVDRRNEKKAMNTLHDAFFLAGVKSVNLFLVGTGLIGSKLLNIMEEQAEIFYNEYQIDLNLRGVANSRKMMVSDEPIPLNRWRSVLDHEGEVSSLSRFTERMRGMNLTNSVFVDCTASPDLQEAYKEILASSISVVTPNKKANSSAQILFDELHDTARRYNAAFRYETNVGAGLPVVGTLHEMVSTGDKIKKIEGVFSGTLSYLFNSYDGSVPFSRLVKQAREAGFTEPDPRDDLSGEDVGRKLLILARVAGKKMEYDEIDVENLVPEKARNAQNTEQFLELLEEHDTEFEAMLKKAMNAGRKLCYIARYEEGSAVVKLEEIDRDHPFYGLSGTDNILAIYSNNYDKNPMVIKGPGAGAAVTASGIIADILRLVNTTAISNSGN
ncbi:MAG: bifunctional aspartate kinase/homoserine dehydrogenase I [Balneolaceae bacterium]|nr:MAG: bifunctional aspartate kinase/homoserine dehydrogenase I [Balneolaceae bacterium]